MNTFASDSNVQRSPLASGELSATPKARKENNQTFALKIQFNDDIRRLNLLELSWEGLVKKVADLFELPEAKVLLKYQDEEGDMVTIGGNEELLHAHHLAVQRGNTLLRLVASIKRKKPCAGSPASNALPLQVQDPFVNLTSPLDMKMQRKALKEQRKLLKEQKKGGKKECKKVHKECKKELKDEKKELKKVDKLAKYEAKRYGAFNLPEEAASASPATSNAEGSAPDRRRWRDMTCEERAALRLARRQGSQQRGCRRGQLARERGSCRNKVVARFVKHVTVPDGTKLEPNQPFVKTWRMRNEGETDWIDCKLIFVSKRNGDLLGASEEVPIPSPVPAGAEIDITVNMVAPEAPGRYVGFWRLADPEGKKFGQRIWVKIDVVCSSSSEDEGRTPAKSFEKLEDEVAESFVDLAVKEDEPPQEKDASAPTMAELLKQLKALGFTNVGRNIPLLTKHNGDINAVIAELLA